VIARWVFDEDIWLGIPFGVLKNNYNEKTKKTT
jgi:hypothetical protein